MSGCFGNTRHDRWIENEVWRYYRETEEREEEEEDMEEEDA